MPSSGSLQLPVPSTRSGCVTRGKGQSRCLGTGVSTYSADQTVRAGSEMTQVLLCGPAQAEVVPPQTVRMLSTPDAYCWVVWQCLTSSSNGQDAVHARCTLQGVMAVPHLFFQRSGCCLRQMHIANCCMAVPHLLLNMQNLAVVRNALDLMLSHGTQQRRLASPVPSYKTIPPAMCHCHCCILQTHSVAVTSCYCC